MKKIEQHNYIKRFIDTISKLSPQFSVHQVFKDFVSLNALCIQQRIEFKEDVEDQYFRLIKPYNKDQLNVIVELVAITALALEHRPHDFLGEVYMSLKISNERAGQFYTPFYVSQLMAKVLGNDPSDPLGGKPFITVNDSCCGAGSMLIAHFAHMINLGLNPQQVCWYEAQDVCSLSAGMCYIQMSLLGMPGRVIIGDTLDLSNKENYPVFYTFMHYHNAWDLKFKKHMNSAKEDKSISIDKPGERCSETVSLKENTISVPAQGDLF